MHSIALLMLKKFNQQRALKTLKQRNPPQKDAGFSMVELITVVLMIGILAAIALPNWYAFVSRQRVNKANDVVLAALQDAQRQAKQKKLTYSVSFRTNNSIPQIAINQGTTPSDWLDFGQDVGIKPGQIVLGTNLAHVNTTSASVSYGSDYVSTAPQTISFSYLGTLTPKTNSNAPDAGLKVVLAVPRSGTTTAGVKRCVIVATLIGGIRTAKDTQCND